MASTEWISKMEFSLERARLEAMKCIRCKEPACIEACPERYDIPRNFKAMVEALDRLLRALDNKVDLLNMLSHDLRLPLSVIIGSVDLMAQGTSGPLTPELEKRIQVIRRNAGDLLAMLNELLTLSRLNAERIAVEVKEFALRDVVSELGADLSPLALAKGLEFQWEVEKDAHVRSDCHKIKEILHNLLTNAIKYTDKGSVTLRAGLEPEGDKIWLAVTDTGRGIPEDELPFIFESFRQVGPRSAQRQVGVGLGLAIVKRLLELLNGQIEVKSALNQGSTFKVILPRAYRFRAKNQSNRFLTLKN